MKEKGSELKMKGDFYKKEMDLQQREIEEYIDAKPKKRIIINKAMRCSFNNAMAEIVDNCLDYWDDIERPKDLEVDIEISEPQSANENVVVRWNMAVPQERWRPLVTPGDVMHRSGSTIGVWGEGFKIAIFATGTHIDIMTNDDGKRNQIHIPPNFLDKDDWRIPVYKGLEPDINLPDDTTMLRLEISKYNEYPIDDYILRKYLGETFGSRMRIEEENGYRVVIRVNGKEIEPITFGLPQDIARNYSFPPGFEPSQHVFLEQGLKIKMIIGLLHTMDAMNYGVYMYGNGRLFASRYHNEVVGFGTRANSPIPAEHPYAKRIQIHVFFEGSPDKIPWQAPLKDALMVEHPIINKVAVLIKKYAGPYADFMKAAKTPEIVVFSSKWNEWDEDKRKKEIFTKFEKEHFTEEELKAKWNIFSESIKENFEVPIGIETWNHGESGKGRKPTESPKFDRLLAKKIIKKIKDRDSGKITSIDLLDELVAFSIGTMGEGKRTSVIAKKSTGEETPLFDPSEGSVTLSVRIDAKDANQLAYIVGERQKSILLKTIIQRYKEIQTLKDHPYLIEKKKLWSDEELIEELRGLLDTQNKQ